MVLIFALTVVVFVLLYLGPYRNPGWLSPGFAGSLFLFGIAAFSTGEFIREAVRKPYVVYNVVLGNQILPEEVPAMRNGGYLEGGVWTKAFVAEALSPSDGHGRVDDEDVPAEIDSDRLLKLPLQGPPRARRGPVPPPLQRLPRRPLGYSAVGPLLQGWPREHGPLRRSSTLNDIFFMPPWAARRRRPN